MAPSGLRRASSPPTRLPGAFSPLFAPQLMEPAPTEQDYGFLGDLQLSTAIDSPHILQVTRIASSSINLDFFCWMDATKNGSWHLLFTAAFVLLGSAAFLRQLNLPAFVLLGSAAFLRLRP